MCPVRYCRYVDYLLDTLSRRELFQWLSLTPSKFWHTLLLRDRWGLLGAVGHLLVQWFDSLMPVS
jgi:hypothetical protein